MILSKLTAPHPIMSDHDLSHFDCGVPVLNDWLRERAFKNESKFSRTYVTCDGSQVVGYYCLSAGAVQRESAPGKLRRNAPDSVPVSIIGRLAVDKNYSGRGLGTDLLADAMRRVAVASQTIGIGALVIQAKDESARNFYQKSAEFINFPIGSMTLFLPIDTLVASFS